MLDKMQLPKTMTAFNRKNIEASLRRENKFITDLLNLLPLPNNVIKEDDMLLEESENKDAKAFAPKVFNKIKTSRAKSLVELQQRLEEISTRKRLSYKEKLLKKNIKSKIKRKGRQGDKSAALKQERMKKETADEVEMKEEVAEEETAKSSSENEHQNKMVFSKFDFSDIGKKKFRKEKYDPQKTLEDLQKQKETLQKLRECGEVEKAVEIKEKSAWKNALAKAQGEKVRDDPTLLTKSIKKREQKLKQTKKKWEARQEGVQKSKEERQKKRQENIDKKKKEKKVKKMKTAVKRGKIIPGF